MSFTLVLVKENEDCIIVKNPVCAKCTESKAKVNIIKTFHIEKSDITEMFKSVEAYDSRTRKYKTNDWKPRLLAIKCECKNDY